MGLGSNLGDKIGQLEKALAALAEIKRTRVTAVSRFYRTAPVGKTDQDWFVNAAALLETGMKPRELLGELLDIERRLGRVRNEKWGPRLIDLDLLFYGDRVIEEEGLTAPHPLLDQRRFVLVPLAEIAPDWVHPVLGLTPGEMDARLSGPGQEVTPC